MLNKRTRSLINFNITHGSIFFLYPKFWNRKTMRYDPLRFKFMGWINFSLVYGSMISMLYIDSAVVVDYLLGIPKDELILNMVYGVAGTLVSFVYNVVYHEFGHFEALLSNIIKTDQKLQDTVLTPEEVEKLQGKRSLTILVANVFEPAMICLPFFTGGLHFYQEYDIPRRYAYEPFKLFMQLDGFLWDLGFIVIYIGFVLLLCAFLYIIIHMVAIYMDTMNFWLNELSSNPRLAAEPLENHVSVYRQLKVLSIHFNDSILMQLITGTLVAGGFAFLVLGFYSTIRMLASVAVDAGANLLMPVATILAVGIGRYWFVEAGKLGLYSSQVLKNWKQKVLQTKYAAKVLTSLTKPEQRVGNVFTLNNETFALYMEKVFTTTVDILLM